MYLLCEDNGVVTLKVLGPDGVANVGVLTTGNSASSKRSSGMSEILSLPIH